MPWAVSSVARRCTVEIGNPVRQEISVSECTSPWEKVCRIVTTLLVTDRPTSPELPATARPLHRHRCHTACPRARRGNARGRAARAGRALETVPLSGKVAECAAWTATGCLTLVTPAREAACGQHRPST